MRWVVLTCMVMIFSVAYPQVSGGDAPDTLKESKKTKKTKEILDDVNVVCESTKKEYISGEPICFTIKIKNNSQLPYKISLSEIHSPQFALNNLIGPAQFLWYKVESKGESLPISSVCGDVMSEMEGVKSKASFFEKDLPPGGSVTYYEIISLPFQKPSDKGLSSKRKKTYESYIITGEKKGYLQSNPKSKTNSVTIPVKVRFKRFSWDEQQFDEIVQDLESKASGDPSLEETKIAILQMFLVKNEKAIPVLSKYLESENETLKRMAIAAISGIDHKDAIKIMNEILAQNSGTSDEARKERDEQKKIILRGLHRNENPEVVSCLKIAKDDPNKMVRREAVNAVWRIVKERKPDDFVHLLEEMGNDSDEFIQRTAKNILERIYKRQEQD